MSFIFPFSLMAIKHDAYSSSILSVYFTKQNETRKKLSMMHTKGRERHKKCKFDRKRIFRHGKELLKIILLQTRVYVKEEKFYGRINLIFIKTYICLISLFPHLQKSQILICRHSAHRKILIHWLLIFFYSLQCDPCTSSAGFDICLDLKSYFYFLFHFFDKWKYTITEKMEWNELCGHPWFNLSLSVRQRSYIYIANVSCYSRIILV